jgi:predicted O-linked N-acetylglucosamine transferase (SPINDLY family)
MAEFFELHNKELFEIVAFSFGPNSNDQMHQRLVNAFDQFIDVNSMTDQQVAELSREMGIDIAIDLKGYTTHCRTGIFSHRAAPIQVNYLGYPASMGANYIDYIIADHIIIPEENQPFFTEKIVYLPNSYQVNDSKRKVSERILTRTELALPENGFVYCCFNNNLKITPQIFDSWARILKAVPGSVLWLLEDNVLAKANLIKEAQSRGLSEERLIFAGRLDLPEHLARHRVADLFIDTVPCNAHTTASDALWVGLPVLTILGEAFAGRVAASLLSAIDMPELIAKSLNEYEALAIDLAKNPEKLKVLKEKLQQNRLTSPLFNTQLSTDQIESAYIKMYERYQAGLPPEHLEI